MNLEDIKTLQSWPEMLDAVKILELRSREAKITALIEYLKKHYPKHFNLQIIAQDLSDQTKIKHPNPCTSGDCKRAIKYREYREKGCKHDTALENAGKDLNCSVKTIEASVTAYNKWMTHLKS